MPKLILSLDDKVIDEFPIDKDTVTIGRRTDNDICLDNLAISGYHSLITTVLNDSFLEDLNSTNGTFVNSKIIKKHALKDGDSIDIGNHRIKYINHLAASSANSEFEKTVVMTPSIAQKNLDESLEDLQNDIDGISDPDIESTDHSSAEKTTLNDRPVALMAAIYDGHEDTSLKVPSIEMLASAEPKKESSQEEPAPKDSSKESTSEELAPEELTSEYSPSEELALKESNTEEPTAKDSASQEPDPEKSISSEPAVSPSSEPGSESKFDADKLGRIQILSGSNCGKELILDKKLTTLGKPEVAVVGITKRNSGYFIVHIDGDEDHPSKLNGETIKGKSQPIDDHDIIDVAGIKLEFFVE